MCQTKMTGMPAPRAASTSRPTFSSTLCRDANAAAPEPANAPCSPTVSFWRSMTSRALDRGFTRLPDRREDGVATRHCRDVLERVVDRGVVPVRVHRRAAVLRYEHEVPLVGSRARGVL